MRQLIYLVLTLCLVASAMGQEMETRVFVLNARPAESTAEMIRPMLSPNG